MKGRIPVHLEVPVPVRIRRVADFIKRLINASLNRLLNGFGREAFVPLDPKPIELDTESFEQARGEAAELGINEWRKVGTLTIVRISAGLDTFEDVAVLDLGS